MKCRNKEDGGLGQQHVPMTAEHEDVFPDEPINLAQILDALRATRELDVNLHGEAASRLPVFDMSVFNA